MLDRRHHERLHTRLQRAERHQSGMRLNLMRILVASSKRYLKESPLPQLGRNTECQAGRAGWRAQASRQSRHAVARTSRPVPSLSVRREAREASVNSSIGASTTACLRHPAPFIRTRVPTLCPVPRWPGHPPVASHWNRTFTSGSASVGPASSDSSSTYSGLQSRRHSFGRCLKIQRAFARDGQTARTSVLARVASFSCTYSAADICPMNRPSVLTITCRFFTLDPPCPPGCPRAHHHTRPLACSIRPPNSGETIQLIAVPFLTSYSFGSSARTAMTRTFPSGSVEMVMIATASPSPFFQWTLEKSFTTVEVSPPLHPFFGISAL